VSVSARAVHRLADAERAATADRRAGRPADRL